MHKLLPRLILFLLLLPQLLLPLVCWSETPDAPPISGQVLVKLKPAFAYLNADGMRLRSNQWKTIAPVLSIDHAVAFSAFKNTANPKRAARTGASGVDLRLYHQLRFDPELPISLAIEELYKSGVVEIAEPVYAAVSFATPNDPQFSSQWYLNLIKAQDAWDDTQGNGEIVIAIIDSGIDLTHPDLLDNLYKNEADPLDGIDNDEDGYIDNYWGWDFAGSDYMTLQGDNNPHIATDNAGHGTKVAGCASAVPNNGIGIAGIGFSTKIMALKHTADNDTRARGRGFLDNLIHGVMYAATHGAHIINASYGNTYRSRIEEDIYKHVVLDLGVLVVAAAGNNNTEVAVYPASYEPVLSVAASNIHDQKAGFTSYGYSVDITAPGEGVLTTKVRGGYEHSSGSSFSAPIVSGAAALLKAKHPHLSGYQIGEILRVSADTLFSAKLEQDHIGKMGVGRLDVKQALSYNGPSLKVSSISVKGEAKEIAQPGEQAMVYCSFKNILWPASQVAVKIVSLSAGIEVLEPLSMLDHVAAGLDAPQEISYAAKPFKIKIGEGVAENSQVMFRIEYSAKGYKDFQYVTATVNQDFLDINTANITTSLASNGRIGYSDASRRWGKGFCLDGKNLLYEMGLIMATAEDTVLSNIRGVTHGMDNDFREVQRINKLEPGKKADIEAYGRFNSSGDTLSKLDLEIAYDFYFWQPFLQNESVEDQPTVLQYTITNKSSRPVKGLFIGLFADWDVTPKTFRDKAGWDSLTNTGYVYSPKPEIKGVGAIQLLTGKPHYWAIDNFARNTEEAVNMGDGFSDKEKYAAISSGVGRAEAGMKEEEGTDVSHAVGAGPYDIAPGASIVVAFALHAGTSVETTLAAAQRIKAVYAETIVPKEEEDIPITVFPKAFPNPSAGAVTIALPSKSKHPYKIRVMNTSGRFISEINYGEGLQELYVALPPVAGMYLLDISGGGHRSLQRVVVR